MIAKKARILDNLFGLSDTPHNILARYRISSTVVDFVDKLGQGLAHVEEQVNLYTQQYPFKRLFTLRIICDL